MSTSAASLDDETRNLILDELFILPDENGKARIRKPKVPDRVVRGVVAMIDSSPIMAKHESYVIADRKPGARGGRPALIQPKHVLASRLMLAEQGDDGTIAEMFMLLRHRLSDDARLMLNLPLPGSVEWRNKWANMHSATVYRAFARFSRYYDPKPMHRRQRELTDEQKAALDPTRVRKRRFTEKERADLEALMDRDGIAMRQRRADELLNDIIGMSVDLWPTHLRERWLGDIAIDETVLEACSQRAGSTNHGRNNRRDDQVLATEVWAGNHAKGTKASAEGGGKDNYKHGFGLHVAVATRLPWEQDFPTPILAASLDTPGMSIAGNSLTVLTAASKHNTQRRFVHHDRGVTQGSEEWHQAVLDLGYQQIRDYKRNEVGFRGELDGVKCVDGNLFGICLPERLENLTPDYLDGKLSEQDYYNGIEARRPYLVQRIAKSSSGKATLYASPSQRDTKTAECDLNPDLGGVKSKREQSKLSDGRTLLTWAQAPTDKRADAPKLCRQQTVTIPDSWMVRYRQPFVYKSPEWRAASSKGHNDIERRHGDFKNRLFEDAGNADMRRYIGYDKHIVSLGCLIVANNFRRLRNWLADHPTGDGIETHPKPKSWDEYFKHYGSDPKDVTPDDGKPLRIVNDPSPLPKTGKAA